MYGVRRNITIDSTKGWLGGSLASWLAHAEETMCYYEGITINQCLLDNALVSSPTPVRSYLSLTLASQLCRAAN